MVVHLRITVSILTLFHRNGAQEVSYDFLACLVDQALLVVAAFAVGRPRQVNLHIKANSVMETLEALRCLSANRSVLPIADNLTMDIIDTLCSFQETAF
jgi:hypothetical protein